MIHSYTCIKLQSEINKPRSMIHLTMLTLQHMERVPYITPTLKWYKYPRTLALSLTQNANVLVVNKNI